MLAIPCFPLADPRDRAVVPSSSSDKVAAAAVAIMVIPTVGLPLRRVLAIEAFRGGICARP